MSLDLGDKSISQIQQRSTALAALGPDTTAANVLTDARAGEMFAIMGDLYLARNDQHNAVIASTGQVRQVRGLSGALVATTLHTLTLAGFPIATDLGGTSFDVDQDVRSVTNLTTDADSVGWSGVGYVVTRGLSADYRISGGASGGGWELPNIPIPPIPTDKGSFGVMDREDL